MVSVEEWSDSVRFGTHVNVIALRPAGLDPHQEDPRCECADSNVHDGGQGAIINAGSSPVGHPRGNQRKAERWQT